MSIKNAKDWLEYGMEMGWCSGCHCYIHEGVPLTTEEADILSDSDDVCVFVIRLLENEEQKEQLRQ